MDRPIKILRIINRFNLGGPTYNATYLTAYLPEQFETRLIGGSHESHEGASTFIPEKHNVNYEIVEEMQREISLSADIKAYKKLKAIIKEYQPDVVHTHASKAGFLGRLAAYKSGVPVIVHTFHGHVFHSYFGKVKTWVYKTIERYMARRSTAIIAISNLQLKELRDDHQIATPEKFKVIPLGFDLDRFRENYEERRNSFRDKYKVREGEIAIGIIGRLTAIKNHDLFLAAIQRLSERYQNLKVFIIGDGELRNDLEQKVKSIHNKSGNQFITFTSWIRNIETALPGLDIVALSSLNEGTPVSLIEAQAAGVPVVTTNVGGVEDVVNHESTGLIVNSFEVKEYDEALNKLIESEEIRAKMSQNGWNHVREKYHYQRLCDDVANLYLELLKKNTK